MFEWSVAERALPGQVESGDLAVVELDGGRALFAVIDGLGHGFEAAIAARAAAATLREDPWRSPAQLTERCHAQLRATRGAAMSVVSISGNQLRWCGVGNVEALLFGASRREGLVLRGGVVGGLLPPLYEASVTLQNDDLLLLVTDGIVARFSDKLDATLSPRQLANDILMRFARATDDALVLAVRISLARIS
jgi:negative regulator of sigma-B (phosphoserine phosphatase)